MGANTSTAKSSKYKLYDSQRRPYLTVENLKMWDWGPHHYVEDGNRIELNWNLLCVCDYICKHTPEPGEVDLRRVYQQIFAGDKLRRAMIRQKWDISGGW